MSSIRFILYTSFDLLASLRKNPRAYIGLLVGIAISLISTIQYLNFAMAAGEPINILEPFIMMGSMRSFMAMIFLCLLFVLSNAPFITERTPYIVVRAKRSNWVLGCVLYIVFTTIIYYSVLLLVTALVSLKFGVTVNAWSQPMYVLSQLQSYSVYDVFGIYFRYADIGKEFLPVAATFYTFLLLSFYSICMAMVMYVINLGVNKYTGTITAVGIHLLGYILLSDGLQGIVSYIPLTNALLGRYGLGDIPLSASIAFSTQYFALIFFALLVLLIIVTKLTDFNMYTGKRQ